MLHPLLPSATSLAMLRSSDAGLLVILALFAWWGARRGAVRQLLSLSVIVGAFYAAGALAPRLVSTLSKLTRLDPGEPLAAAWAAALFGALVVGAILLRFVTPRLPAPGRSPADRWLGGLLGVAKGLLVAVVVGYALLGVSDRTRPTTWSVPSLSRPQGAEAPPLQGGGDSGLTDRLRGSVSAEGLLQGASLLARYFQIPPWVQDQVDAVNARLAPGPVRRPRER